MTAIAQDMPLGKKTRTVSLQTFLQRYSNIEDGYKYEFNNGVIEKTKTMDQEQTTLFAKLLRMYISTKSFQEGGTITSETNMNTTDLQLRKPDIAIYSAEQLSLMKNGQNQVAEWVAEVISETDQINHVNKKLEEYFQAGVKVVWHIFPNIETVYVYTATDKVAICKGEKICSGAPAVSDFQISAAQLFSKS
jgi:Uma2 family endonuclease